MADGEADTKDEGSEKPEKKVDPPKRSLLRKILRVVGIIGAVIAVVIVGFVIYVQATWERDFKGTPLPAVQASKDPEVIQRGAYVTHAIAHCSACHQHIEPERQRKLPANIDDMRGGLVMPAGPFGTFFPANLTSDPETGIAKLSDAELGRVIRHGVAPSGKLDVFMSMAVGPMAEEDIVAIVSYLRSIPPVKNGTRKDEWGFIAKALASKLGPKPFTAPPFVKEGGISVERGLYLAKGPALCFGCHSPLDFMNGFALTGPEFSGAHEAEPDHEDQSFEVMAPNLTSDPKTGILSNFSEDAFIDRIKKAGRTILGSTMPWENFARMTDDDLRSIYRYLKTVPPANRATGPTRRPRGSWKG